jgi:hypothetical protein
MDTPPLPPPSAVPDASPASLACLPKDWAALAQHAGLRSFLAVPIGSATETVGLLTIAKDKPGCFDDEW